MADWSETLTLDLLVGSLAWSASGATITPARVNRGLRWFRQLAGRGFEAVPFSLIYDLGWLVTEGEGFVFGLGRAGHGIDDPVVRRRHLALGRLLGGLSVDPGFCRASFAVGCQSDPDEPCARVVERLLRSLREAVGQPADVLAQALGDLGPVCLNPATLRAVAARGTLDPVASLERIERQAAASGSIGRQLDGCVEHLLRARSHGPALQPEDVREIESWQVLARGSQRLLARRLNALVRLLGPVQRRGLAFREESAQVDTALSGEATWPEGGLAGLTNRGSLENLVPSELIYLDEAPEDAPEVDLFTMRALEGELLYYLRDEGAVRRRRRTVVLAADASAAARLRMPGSRETLSLLAYGLNLRLCEDLLALHRDVDVRVKLVLLAPEGPDLARAREDRALLEAMLHDPVARGLVEVTTTTHLDLEGHSVPGRALVSVVVVPADSPLLLSEAGLASLRVTLGESRGGGGERPGDVRVVLDGGSDVVAVFRGARDIVAAHVISAGVEAATSVARRRSST